MKKLHRSVDAAAAKSNLYQDTSSSGRAPSKLTTRAYWLSFAGN